MSASQADALSAIAFQLSVALEAYEREVAGMVRAPLDPEQYRCVSRRMDEMRMYSAALPSVSVAWVEVTIRHFELLQGIWTGAQQGTPDPARLEESHRALRDAVQRLSRKCGLLMPVA
jgi:hypothetical protein